VAAERSARPVSGPSRLAAGRAAGGKLANQKAATRFASEVSLAQRENRSSSKTKHLILYRDPRRKHEDAGIRVRRMQEGTKGKGSSLNRRKTNGEATIRG